MKKVVICLLLILLVFINCRRKSSNSVTTPGQNDTTETPPAPPGSAQDSTSNQSTDTTAVQTARKFTYLPDKQNLENENIGIVYKEDKANVLSVNINIRGGKNVFGVTFDLNYDSARLKLKSVKEGSFLNKDGAKTTILFSNPSIVVCRAAGQSGGVSGDGIICTIELEAGNIFDSAAVGFKKQSVTNSQGTKIFADAGWFGGILRYK